MSVRYFHHYSDFFFIEFVGYLLHEQSSYKQIKGGPLAANFLSFLLKPLLTFKNN